MTASPDAGCIQVERSPEGWAVVTLNRPHKLNALSIQLRQQLHAQVKALEQDPGIHVLILTGDGKVFTAGLDLDEWNATDEPAAAAFTHDAVASLKQFSGPVIAAIQGAAITGGVEIALACDLIVASSQAKFADTHAHVGLLPGWGGSVRLAERVGMQRAKELALTGRFSSAQEALQWGLVNHVVEPDQLLPFAQDLARQMLRAEPAHMKAYKALLDAEAEILQGAAMRYEREQAKAHNARSSLTQIQARLARFLKHRDP
jgi:enoyl-CoA hydratase